MSRMTVLVSHSDADLDDITAVITVLFQYMQITSSKGNIPLSELSFPSHSLPSLVLDESPSPVDTDSPSSVFLPDFFDDLDLEPSSPRFFTAPSSPSEWNPSADPIVECGRGKTPKYIAPGSEAAVYYGDSGSNSHSSAEEVEVKVYQPSPKRAFGVDVTELETSVEQEMMVLEESVMHSRISAVKACDWRDWIDWCRVQV